MVVNMSKILNFLKLCLHQKDPYPWGIYETSLMNVPPEVLRELEEMVDNRRKQLDGKLGKHLKKIDFDAIERMQAEGMTNKQICEQLGIAKATFYLKMKEYRQNS